MIIGDTMKEIREWSDWYRMIQAKDILDPESEYKFKAIPEGLFKNIQRRAANLLASQPHSSTFVKQHWQAIIDGIPPYGLVIEKRTKKGVVYVPNTSELGKQAESESDSSNRGTSEVNPV
jgi:hypothetical protein